MFFYEIILKFHVIGCGSIGQRHIKNLLFLKHDVTIYDTNDSLVNETAKKFHLDIEKKINNDMDCIIICTPPSSHIAIAKIALKKNIHIFIEKPLSNSIKNISQFSTLCKSSKSKIFVGYVFRFDKGLQKIRKILLSDKIGKILSFDAYEGYYLPLWRPWQNYKKSYTSSKKLGGGIILDGSHELNYLLWLGGNIKDIFSYYRKIPSLKVNTEGLAEILLRFNSGAIGRIHLDFINPKYTRRCEIIGEKGSIRWDFSTKTVEIQKSGNKNFSKISYDDNNNEMYINELKHVISFISGKSKNNLISLKDAQSTLLMSIAIQKSGKTGYSVSL